MADVITRFKLETTQYDSKLRDESNRLAEFTRRASLAGKEFDRFTASQIDAVRELGKMAPAATNVKDRVKELTQSYNTLAKTYNVLTKEQQQADYGKAMAESLKNLQGQISATKKELYGMGDAMKSASGSFLGGDKLSGMMQVFGGNLMTKAAGMVTQFGNEIAGMVQQGAELARQGEGIRMAFERLGRGDILQGLREATHGTVTDLELMKAAVKFNDFKLPLDQLGTLLAFAQQKAKDTGESVDYMVNSIVTGLGRKSLNILDNLGLSASEVKDRMKETGDMTKAVSDIIREKMSKAGDYVETAADRAAQANVRLQNKMEELGRKFQPLQEASTNLWTSMKLGILNIIGGPLTSLINGLTRAGRLAQQYGIMGGDSKLKRMIGNLSGASEGDRQSIYQQQQAEIWRYINRRENYFKDRDRWLNTGDEGLRQSLVAREKSFGTSNVNDIKAQIAAAKKLLTEYQQEAKKILTSVNTDIKINSVIESHPGKSDTNDKKELAVKTELQQNQEKINALTQEYVKLADDATKEAQDRLNSIRAEISLLEQRNTILKLHAEQAQGKYQGGYVQTTGLGYSSHLSGNDYLNVGSGLSNLPSQQQQPSMKTPKEMAKDLSQATQTLSSISSGINNIFSGLESIGVEVPDELKGIMNGITGMMTILTGISSLVLTITAIQGAKAIPVVGTFLANGGIVHAAGGWVGGSSYSGDNVPALLNSGEVVLNKAQQGNIASQLQDGSRQMQIVGEIEGEKIVLVANRSLKRSGRGELVTWKN